MKETKKKSSVKKWLGWVAAAIFVIAVIANMTDDKTEPAGTAETADVVESSAERSAADNAPNSAETMSPEDEIKSRAEEIVSDIRGTKIADIEINPHAGTEDNPDDYIVLLKLVFEHQNRAKTFRNLVENWNNEIGALLAEDKRITELVIFWEVPYLREDWNVVKATLKRSGDVLVFDNVWYDPQVFE